MLEASKEERTCENRILRKGTKHVKLLVTNAGFFGLRRMESRRANHEAVSDLVEKSWSKVKVNDLRTLLLLSWCFWSESLRAVDDVD